MSFRNNYFKSQLFFMSCYFTKIFAHRLVIATVRNFRVYDLTGWDPMNTYLFKGNNRNSGKNLKRVQS